MSERTYTEMKNSMNCSAAPHLVWR